MMTVAGVALLLCVTPLHADKKKKDAKPTAASAEPKKLAWAENIVWPAPPSVPRVKYLDFFSADKSASLGNAGKGEKKKASWMDRMAGTATEKERMTDPTKAHFQLLNPYGIAVDSKGSLYIADTKVGAVFIFNTETRDTDMIRNGPDARFGSIYGLAIDDNDRLFVVDAYYRHVLMFNANHKLEAVIGEGAMSDPCGVAVDVENRLLYVVDTGYDQVLVFDLDTLRPKHAIGTSGKDHTLTGPGDFSKPTNIAIDSDQNIYVTDTYNNRVEVFDADGTFIREFGKEGDGPGDFARPKGIAVDSDGHVWVADAMLNRVQIYDREGKFLLAFGSFGPLPGQFQALAGLAIDPKTNRVFTSEQYLARVQMYRYFTNDEARAELKLRAGQIANPAAAANPAAKPAEAAGAQPAPASTAPAATQPGDTTPKHEMKLAPPEAAQQPGVQNQKPEAPQQ
jgi:DNA-binding beta-propeller fold protein YncE